MIKIKRGDCPESLNSTSKILAKNDYKKDDVISSLWGMQHQKCCYCEKDLTDIGKPERWVEHFVPQSDKSFKTAGVTDWNLANAWENLLYTCAACNLNKGSQPPFAENGDRILIDPSFSEIDPEEYIGFKVDGYMIVYKEKNDRTLGKNTINNLKLKKRTDNYKYLKIIMGKINSIFSSLYDCLIHDQTLLVSSKLLDLSRMTSSHLHHAGFSRYYIGKKLDEFNTISIPQINDYFNKSIDPLTVDIAKEYRWIK